jgi:hypothetical protein
MSIRNKLLAAVALAALSAPALADGILNPGGSSGGGTVTSIATTAPIAGGTITATGTISCATCVTSAAALTNNALMIGQAGQAAAVTTTGTGVLTALGINIGSAGAPILFNGAGGTPSSITLINGTGLPIAGTTGWGTGVATLLAGNSSGTGGPAGTTSPVFTGTVTVPTPFTIGAVSMTATGTQLNYLNAATGTTGTTSTNVVFSTSPVLVTPNLGTPSALTLTSATGLPCAGLSNMATGVCTFLITPSSANLAAALTDKTGTGLNVFQTSPALVTPTLGVATATSVAIGAGSAITSSGAGGSIAAVAFSGSATDLGAGTLPAARIGANSIDLTTKVTGILPAANGGTGTATTFTAGSVVYAGASGIYSQDNANLFWDGTNHRLGIGSAVPYGSFQSVGSTANYPIITATNGNFSAGSAGSGLYVASGANTGDTYTYIQAFSNGNAAANSLILQKFGGNVGINTTAPTAQLSIVAGAANQLTENETYGTSGVPLTVDNNGGYFAHKILIYALPSAPAISGQDPFTAGLVSEVHFNAGTAGITTGLIGSVFNEGTWTTGGDSNTGGTGVAGFATTTRGNTGGVSVNVNGLYSDTAATTLPGAVVQGEEIDTHCEVGAACYRKVALVIASPPSDTTLTTGTLTVNGTSNVILQEAGIQITASSGSPGGAGYQFGMLTIRSSVSSGNPPIRSTGALWRSGGFPVNTGLDWRDMTFSGQAILLPNGARISALDTAGSSTNVIRINTANAGQVEAGDSTHGLSVPAWFNVGRQVMNVDVGEIGVATISPSGSAPGAYGAKLALVCGTNAGTAKLIIYAGTSSTPVTIVDNIGGGVVNFGVANC